MADDVIDQIDQIADVDQSAETQEVQTDSSQDSQQVQQTETDKIDGRKFNPEWSKALKELRELYPDKADMFTKMRDTYARYQELQGLAPKGLDDVRGWKSTIEALGGSEKAAEMMQRVADVEQVDARIESADYTVISELPEGMRNGIYQMLPEMLSDLRDKDQNAYNSAMMPHFSAALADTGMGELADVQMAALSKAYKAVTDPDARAAIQEAYTKASQLKSWYEDKTKGAVVSGQKSVDPQVQRLQRQLDERNANDDKAFVGGIVETTNKYVGDYFTQSSAAYIKQLGLTDVQQADLKESFEVKLTNKLASDSAFQKQLGAYKSIKASPQTINDYIKGKIDDPTVGKAILDGLVTSRYPGRQKKAATDTTQPTTSGGSVRVATAPEQSQWDMGKMEAAGYENTVKKGIFYLQGGRTVQLARPN